MGNKTSSLEVYLETEEPLTAGAALKGHVVLRGTNKSCHDGNLQLAVVGKEVSMIFSGSRQLRRAEKRFFQTCQTIRCPGFSSVRSSKVTVPFQIQLPASLPSSMSFPPRAVNFESKGVSIQYTLSAGIGSLHRELVFHCRSEDLSMVPRPFLIQPKSFPMRTLFLHRGAVVVTASVDDTQAGRGETLPLRIAVWNESNVEIDRIQVKLSEHIYWKMNDGGQKREETATLTLDSAIWYIPTSQVLSQRKRDQNRKVKRTDSRVICRALYEAMVLPSNLVCLTVPHTARDSYHGTLMHLWHSLKIKLLTPTFASKASVSIGLKLGHRSGSALTGMGCESIPRLSPVSSLASSTQDDGLSTSLTTEHAPAESDPRQLPIFPWSLTDLLESSSSNHEASSRRRNEMNDSGIPIVDAVPLDEYNSARSGEDPIIFLDEGAILVEDFNALSDLVPLPPPNEVSLPSLLHQMACVDDPCSVIRDCMKESKWISFVETLGPVDFRSIVEHISDDDHQIQTATLLASAIDQFTCEFALIAIKSVSEWNRVGMVQHLLPFIQDIVTNYDTIVRELSDWETMILSNDLEEAIAKLRAKERERLSQQTTPPL